MKKVIVKELPRQFGYWIALILVNLFLSSLAEEISTVPGPHTEVRDQLGRPTFFVDGQPFTEPLFATYVPTREYYSQMAATGIKLFNFQTNNAACDIGFSQPTWKSPDEWDFSQMDERAHSILAARPDAWIMPRIYIGTPKWWYEKYPEEMIVLDHGGTLYEKPYNEVVVRPRPYPSLASHKWREDMAMALRKTLEHIHSSDWGRHVFGYQLGGLGSEEWYYYGVNQEQLADYSIPMRDYFRQWLRKKYQTEENLRKAWNQPDIAFDTVQIPTREERTEDRNLTFRDPRKKMNVIDFYLCYNDLIPETIDYFAGVIKEMTGRRKVVGPFYHYLFEFRGNPEFGHNGGYKMLTECPNVDFILNSPTSYQRDLATGADYYRHPMLSGTLHGKLWAFDNDSGSYLYPKVFRRLHTDMKDIDPLSLMTYIRSIPTAQQSLWLFYRTAGMVLSEGIYETYFDLHGGYYSDTRLLHGMEDIRKLLDRGKNYDRTSCAEILVVADEASQAYLTFQSDWSPTGKAPMKIGEALMGFQQAFLKSGATFDSIYLEDLDRVDLNRYKLILFLNTWHMNSEHRNTVKQKVLQPGKTVIWCYAPGYFNANESSPELMESLTGIRIVPSQEEKAIKPLMELTPNSRDFLTKQGENVPDQPMGMNLEICKLFEVVDPGAETLATLPGSSTVTLASKTVNGATSIYALSSVLAPEFVRALAKSSGIHIYNNQNDTLYGNKSFLVINASSAGERIIRLQGKADVYDAMSERLLYKNVESFEASFMLGETLIYRMDFGKN